MAGKSIDERISNLEKQQEQLDKKKEQLDKRRKALVAKKNQQERKARTKRLIEVGAIIEELLEIEFDTQEKKDALIEVLTTDRGNSFSSSYTYKKNMSKEITAICQAKQMQKEILNTIPL